MSIISRRLHLAGLLFGIGIATTACTAGYGYSGIDAGYADPYYVTDSGGYGSYPSYGYGGFGWYGDYYYPGTGIYVYDRARRPYRWNDNQRRYWEGRRGNYRGGRNEWNGFTNHGGGRDERSGYRHDEHTFPGTGLSRSGNDRHNGFRPRGDGARPEIGRPMGNPSGFGGGRGRHGGGSGGNGQRGR